VDEREDGACGKSRRAYTSVGQPGPETSNRLRFVQEFAPSEVLSPRRGQRRHQSGSAIQRGQSTISGPNLRFPSHWMSVHLLGKL